MIVVPTLHPAALLRGSDDDGLSKFEPTVIDDLKKALRLRKSHPNWDESIITERDATGRPWRLFPTPVEIQWFIERFYAACARHPQAVAEGTLSLVVDVETTKDSPVLSLLICTGLGFKAPDEEQVINVPTLCQGGVSYWDPPTWAWVQQLLARVLADTRVPKSFHNKAFDKVVLWAQGMPVFGWCWDTMAAHHVEDGELPHNLAYVSSRITDSRYWKDDVKGDGGFLSLDDYTLRLYNLRDILVTMRIAHPLYLSLKRVPRLFDLYVTELKNIEVMIRATMRGLLIDEERRSSTQLGKEMCPHCTTPHLLPDGLGPKLHHQRDVAVQTLRVVANDTGFDPARPIHVRDLFFNSSKLNLPVVKTSKRSGQPAVDKEAMMLLELLATTPSQKLAIKAVINYRQADKLLGTFVEGLPISPMTGRVHPQWKLLAVSGRYTTSPNAQNWPKKVKRLFRAPDGWKFVGVDLSQAELRYIAYLAHDRELIRMYAEDINVHTVNATLLFKIRCPKSAADNINPQTEAYLRAMVPIFFPGLQYDSFPEVPPSKWKPIRTLAKNFVFGCLKHDTEVATLHGSVAISKIQPGEWVWCWDGAKYTPTRVKRAWSTGTKRVMRLTVRDGAGKRKTLDLTPNHEVMLRDGSMRAVALLQPGDRLMPFRRTSSNGYCEIDPRNDGSRVYEHRWVCAGPEVVHHSNGDKRDNRPENLIGTTRQAHLREHHHPPVVSDAGRARAAEAAREMWIARREELVSKLTAARVASPAWREGVKQGAATRKARGIKKPKTQGVCACGSAAIAKGLCKSCYNREYRFKKNHVVISVELLSAPCDVWDLEVEHPAHNFALADSGFFVSNSNYGAEAETVYSVLRSKRDPDSNELLFPDIMLSEIQALRVLWTKQLHPEIPQWWDDVSIYTKMCGGFACPISGRTRWFRGGFKRNEMLNFPIQTGVASWVNEAMIEIQDTYDRETGGAAQIVQQVHDALNVEAPDDYAKRAGEIMVEVLSRPFQLLDFPDARLPADAAQIATHLDKV